MFYFYLSFEQTQKKGIGRVDYSEYGTCINVEETITYKK